MFLLFILFMFWWYFWTSAFSDGSLWTCYVSGFQGCRPRNFYICSLDSAKKKITGNYCTMSTFQTLCISCWSYKLNIQKGNKITEIVLFFNFVNTNYFTRKKNHIWVIIRLHSEIFEIIAKSILSFSRKSFTRTFHQKFKHFKQLFICLCPKYFLILKSEWN